MPNDPTPPRLTLTGSGTRVLIVATEDYPQGELATIGGVLAIARRLAQALATRCGVDPANIELLENPANPDAIAIAFTTAAQQATDTLVFYYIGHGVFNDDLTLMLGTQMTTGPNNQRGKAWPVTEIQRISTDHGGPRLLVLLDCCNSGRAQSSSLVKDFDLRARGRGMFILAAAYREAHAAPDNQGTVFTLAFLDLLTKGSTHAARWIRVCDIPHLMQRLLDGRATKRGDPAPIPIQATTGNIGYLILASNLQGPEPTTRLAHLTDLADIEYDGPCPWTDLAPIYATTTAQLFGRDAFLTSALTTISELAVSSGLITLAGASGVGKTSAVHAGLLPAIAAGALSVPRSNLWPQFTMTPGTNPIETLTTTLATHLSPARDLDDQLRSCPDQFDSALTRAMREHPTPEHIVLVIDQFEELFSDRVDKDDRALFIRALIALADGPALVLLCSRADFYGAYLEDPILGQALSPQRQLNLPPMSEPELREVITGPTDAAGMAIEARLADQIINDLREGTRLSSASLPMLSCALTQTWHNRLGSVLTHDGYTAAGGVGGAIAQKADQIYQELADKPHVLTAAKRILIALVQFRATSGPVRQAVTIDNLVVGASDEQRSASAQALTALRDARLVVIDDDTHLARLVHDALIREWGTLAGWISEHKEGSATRDNLIADAEKWASAPSARNSSYLYRDDALVIAERFAENHPLGTIAREFLDASRQLRAREQHAEHTRRTRELHIEKAHSAALRVRARILIALTTAAVLVAITAGFYFVRARAAQQQATALLYTTVATHLVQDAQQLFGRGRDTRRAVLETLAAHALAPETTTLALLGAHIHTSQVTALARLDGIASQTVTVDTRWRVLGDYTGTVRVWDTHTATDPRPLIGTAHDAVVSVSISPDGRWVAAGDVRGAVRVWDTRTSEGPLSLAGTGNTSVNGVAISPDGHWITATDSAGAVRVWNGPTTNSPRMLPGADQSGLDGVAISPDGRWIAAATLTGSVTIWDTTGDPEPRPLPGAGNWRVRAIAISSDGRQVATGDELGWVRVWDVRTATGPRVLSGSGNAPTLCTQISPDAQHVVVCDIDGAIRTWDLAQPQPQALPDLGLAETYAMAISPDGRWIALSDNTGQIGVLDRQSPTPLQAFPGTSGSLALIAINNDGQVVIGDTANTGAVRLWNAHTQAPPRTLIDFHYPFASGLSTSSDGRWAVAGDIPDTVRVWDLRTTDEPKTLQGQDNSAVSAVGITPDGQWVVAGHYHTGAVRLWDTHTAGNPRTLRGTGNADVYQVAISNDGRWIAAGDAAGVVRLWDTKASHNPQILTGLSAAVYSLAISPDGRWILAGDTNGAIRIWSTDAQQIGTISADQNLGTAGGFGFDHTRRSITVLSTGGISLLPFPAPDTTSLCATLTQPMSAEEWREWVSPDIPQRPVCPRADP
ncbi:WD40 repeat domain-containing protein [Nocardia jejuensis]|uniref:WD40 repeat domain-containing protein n=1 Tax=Nocardia jejuensis TaxID=328049 RepID=UPI000A985F7A|nr:WD40 repeat domain-containing protein [Nocardia jejuensis]